MICAIGLVPLPVRAGGESPLAQLPADTPVVISIHGVERTKHRLAALIEKAVPDLAPQALAHLKEMTEKGLEGRKLTGLDPDGPVFVAVTSLPQAGSQPTGAIVAKVTDYKAFRNGILTDEERKNLKKDKGIAVATIEGKEFYFVDRKGYVVITPEKEVAEQFHDGKATGLDKKLSKGVASRLLESDVALYVDMAAINRQYGEMLQSVRQFVPAMLENAPQVDKATMKFVKAYIDGFFQCIQDSKHLLLTLSIPPEGIAFHIETGFGKDTPTNKFLAKLKPSAVTGLDTLPPGYLAYGGMAPWGPDAIKTVEPLLRGFLGSSDEANTKALDKALDELAAAGPGTSIIAGGLRGQGLQVVHYKEPARAADAMLKMYQSLGNATSFGTMPLKEKPTIQPNAETYRGNKFNHFSMKWDLEKQFENLPGGGEKLAEAMKKLTGEGVNGWFGAVDDAVVSVQAKDWKTAEKMLDRYMEKKATVGEKYKGFDSVRHRLPEKATMVGLVSVPQLVNAMAQYGSAMWQGFTGKAAPEIPAAKGAEPFLGGSVTLRSGYGSIDLWIPVETAGVVRRVVEAFKSAAEGQ
jgi:hypothetical protein